MLTIYYSQMMSVAVLLISSVSVVHTQSPPPTSPDDLVGTYWQLVKFEDSGEQVLTPTRKGRYTIEFEGGGRVIVRIDCNRGHGTWKSAAPNQLELGPIAITRAICAPAPLNNRIAKDWQNVRSYTMRNDHLFLSLGDGGIYEFEPRTLRALHR